MVMDIERQKSANVGCSFCHPLASHTGHLDEATLQEIDQQQIIE